jgi:DNA-binding NtrC family response regulator
VVQAATDNLPRKVLVVDDESDVADLTAMILAAHGITTPTAYSARDALALLASDDEIEAVVSDIMMPGMTGLQLGDAVRLMYPKVKIVLVSGFTLPSELERRERPYLFATKPYKFETLLKLLRS